MRIYASDNEPIDFCRNCFPTEKEAIEEYGNIGDGPDDRGNCFAYDSDHPPYQDGVLYICMFCDEVLEEFDEKI